MSHGIAYSQWPIARPPVVAASAVVPQRQRSFTTLGIELGQMEREKAAVAMAFFIGELDTRLALRGVVDRETAGRMMEEAIEFSRRQG